MISISVANVKSHLSEIIAKSAHGHERFIITRCDKPVAVISGEKTSQKRRIKTGQN